MKKRIVSVLCLLLALLFCLASCGVTTPTTKKSSKKKATEEEATTPKTILYLGDSIAEAVAGPSPVSERENYGYYGVLGNINGYEFYNRAVSGYQTEHLLEFIQREDDGINRVKSLISTADIIHISIGGNDLLGYDISNMIVEAAQDIYTEVETRTEIAYKNLENILAKIREMNPDAQVILQTVYNPIGPNSPLVYSWTANRLKALSYSSADYHKLAGRMIDKLNGIFTRYLEEHTEKNIFGQVTYTPFELVDVNAYIEKVYEKNPTRWEGLFAPDGIHPNAEGHALIAEVTQQKLEELSLADGAKALENYKALRAEQLNRLYKGIINVSTAVAAVNAAVDMEDVTFAYFDAIQGKTPYFSIEKTAKADEKHFEEDLTFEITKLNFSGIELTQMEFFGISIYPFSTKRITFREDGTYEVRVECNETFITLLKTLITNTGGSINVTDMIGFDIEYLQNSYITQMFPGFDYTNLENSLKVLNNALGVEILGIDFDKQSVRRIAQKLAETGDIIIGPEDVDALGTTFGLTFSGTYCLKEVSALNGVTYTGIYLNGNAHVGEPYFRFTYTEGEKETIRLTVDVAAAQLEAER